MSDEEVARRYPCDELRAATLPAPTVQAWRGVTVQASAAAVWPWIGQIRLAPYSYEWIDNLGRRSPQELRAMDPPAPGQPFTTAGGRSCGRILSVEPDEQLTGEVMGALMSYVLVPHRGSTRLLLKVVAPPPAWLAPLLCAGDLVMARRQLLNLRRLAEA